jgi:hypothetical protein
MWARFKEAQQIAVITLGPDHNAHIDLFVSMRNETQENQLITFFIPLGMNAANFSVVEKNSIQFDQALTENLDLRLEKQAKQMADYRSNVHTALLLGSLVVNGAWSWPIWLPALVASCAMAPPPLATYETESSSIAIYELDQNVDLQALIETTGLDPSVTETLSRFQGQQIAIINLEFDPYQFDTDTYGTADSLPGIHLSWDTTFVSNEGSSTYSYPLGTGSAWAHPIELTRVYVVAQPGVDFEVRYPSLGEDLSGYTSGLISRRWPKIQFAQNPSFAIDNAVGDFGRIWRAIYVRSNATEDIIITKLESPSQSTLSLLQQFQFQRYASPLTWVFSLVASTLLWVVVWRYIMSRILGVRYGWRDLNLWREALGWALIYPLTNFVAVVLTIVIGALTAGYGFIVGVPIMIVSALGLVSAFAFGRRHSKKFEVTRRRAEFTYIAIVLLTNALYIPLAFLYARLVGAI